MTCIFLWNTRADIFKNVSTVFVPTMKVGFSVVVHLVDFRCIDKKKSVCLVLVIFG